jgi:N utilization substance protein A
MNKEFIRAVEKISLERGISKRVILEAIEEALVSAYQKRHPGVKDIRISIDENMGEIKMYVKKRVVEVVKNEDREIELKEAQTVAPNVNIQDELEVEEKRYNLTRIAAQTTREIITQKLRQIEQDNIYNEYFPKIGKVITGVVHRVEKKSIILDLGTTQAILPQREQIGSFKPKIGDTLKVYLLEVKKSPQGVEIIVSHSHPELIRALLTLEIPEISEGVVEIKKVAREAGSRSKVAVTSKNPDVDPVGTCLGMRSERIQGIVRTLRGEKIDVIKWEKEPKLFLAQALAPAKLEQVFLAPDSEKALVIVSPEQLSLAIGKKGENVRLAVKLTELKIDIISKEEYERNCEQLLRLKNLNEEKLQWLLEWGIGSLEALEEEEVEKIEKMLKISRKEAKVLKKEAGKTLLKLRKESLKKDESI